MDLTLHRLARLSEHSRLLRLPGILALWAFCRLSFCTVLVVPSLILLYSRLNDLISDLINAYSGQTEPLKSSAEQVGRTDEASSSSRRSEERDEKAASAGTCSLSRYGALHALLHAPRLLRATAHFPSLPQSACPSPDLPCPSCSFCLSLVRWLLASWHQACFL